MTGWGNYRSLRAAALAAMLAAGGQAAAGEAVENCANGMCPLLAAPTDADAAAKVEARFHELLRAELSRHPELVMEALQTLQQRQLAAKERRAEETIAARAAELFESADDPSLGASGEPAVLVEFADYNCGYCRKAEPVIDAMLQADPRLRIAVKELPILSKGSSEAAQVALAVAKIAPGHYAELRRKLYAADKPVDGLYARERAVELGVDLAALDDALKDPAILAKLKANHDLAQALGVEGTPAFVTRGRLIGGAVPQAELEAAVAAARQGAVAAP